MPSLRKFMLLMINLASTFLTLFTGLRENPLIVYITGRYDLMRSRLREGGINYEIVRPELFRKEMLADLTDVGNNYRFFSAPTRGPANVGEDRSTCLRVNSINATVITINYDDFWGKAPRRTQINLHSISAPNCFVANFQPEWVTSCIEIHGGDASLCHQYILDNFYSLSKNRSVLFGIESDYGKPGAAYLKCLGRPVRQFHYMTDLMVHQNYWAGGNYYIMFHSSDCLAVPLVRSDDLDFVLFEVQPMDDKATVRGAIDNEGLVTSFVTVFYGIVTVALIIRGIFAAVAQSREVFYVPNAVRFLGEQRLLKYIFPVMEIATIFPRTENSVIHFKGNLFMASDVWMNHWLYILASIMDSVVNVRFTYIIFQTGTWMLRQKVNFENFLFMCSALTKITWLMCAVNTAMRWSIKLVVRGMRSIRFGRPSLHSWLEWYADASTLFLSYKVYSLLQFVLLYFFVVVNGNTTFMVRQNPPKTGVFGGAPNIAQFWKSELTCDFFVVLSVMTFLGYIGGTLILFTRYKYVVNNGVIRLLQRRYMFVGWDAFVAMEALGIDPMNPKLLEGEVVTTSCSIGSLLRQMFTSGPSGIVTLAGDYIFEDGGFTREPVKLHYPVKQAIAMGLCERRPISTGALTKRTAATTVLVSKSSTIASAGRRYFAPSKPHEVATEQDDDDDRSNEQPIETKSIFDRHLLIFTHGRWGKILLVDEAQRGKIAKKKDSSLMEYVVQDALTYMSILDIKPLLGNDKKLRIS